MRRIGATHDAPRPLPAVAQLSSAPGDARLITYPYVRIPPVRTLNQADWNA
jgi:hypothetical protein